MEEPLCDVCGEMSDDTYTCSKCGQVFCIECGESFLGLCHPCLAKEE